ncbi:PucR family transcriptional regulator ligand-binding domain-containing protein [Phytoactinopolyspora mesophila]|uniref:PucR family transcriptional regulator ligand-binding domain-containing protein n=1 Tax=Phytoactinopolyspora mesophila TaxID=2650750 RepID=UPI001C9E222F|nr:PucR family transcriptional regulator ligand-binding domain-containing protein [Phytoactinopolyspora mesophila]
MSSPIDIVAALGAPLLHVVVAGADRGDVRDVFLAEPHDAVPGEPGDLVLGIGVPGPEEAVQLVRRCAASGAAAVIMRTAVATPVPVAEAAQESSITLVAAGDGVPWAHLVWLLRGVIDRSMPPPGASSAADTSPGTYDDLFALADTVAAIVGAPVTFEDSGSRVLAYSSGQGQTDTARVATIVGRRVPEEVAAHYRARGVFRRLVRSDEPFLVPAGPDGMLPRLVVPVRAGGSGWAPSGRSSMDPSTTRQRLSCAGRHPSSRCTCCGYGRRPTSSGAALRS